jgi:hypothetical protein
MICTMDRSSGKLLGYSVSGDVTKADYGTLVPAVAAVVKEQGSVCLLLDVTDFHVEKLDAVGSEVDFGKQFHGEIDKMAIVGNEKWEKPAAALCKKFGVSNWKFFETDDDAWTWLGA